MLLYLLYIHYDFMLALRNCPLFHCLQEAYVQPVYRLYIKLGLYFVNHGKINVWIEQVYFTVELENIVYTTATQSVSFAEFLLPRSQYLLTFNVHIATRRFQAAELH